MRKTINSIRQIALKKYQNELIVAMALILLGAGAGVGYNAADHQQTILIDAPNYNPYKAPVTHIDSMMQDVISNPTKESLEAAQRSLFYTYKPWVDRRTDSQKENFIAYLESCNQVILSLYHKESKENLDVKIQKMNLQKGKLI